METLASFSTKIFPNKNNHNTTSRSSRTHLGRFLRSLQINEHLCNHQQKETKLVISSCHVASDAKLQRECVFGEQFLLVGNAPSLGLWDPSNAIPLNWSDGHIWTADIDVPVEFLIQFKFVLKQSTGDLLWQPGPDRIFRTWEANNTIIIAEDWENAKFKKIKEGNNAHDLRGVLDVMFSDNITDEEKPSADRYSMNTNKEVNMERERVEDKMALFGYEEEGPVLVPGLNLAPLKLVSSQEALPEGNKMK